MVSRNRGETSNGDTGMSMDLTEDCPHCPALKGEICTDDCEVNGEKIKRLRKALSDLDMTLVYMDGEHYVRCGKEGGRQ